MSLLAPIDIPKELHDLYEESKILSQNLVSYFQEKAEVRYLLDGGDLFKDERGFAFVEEGIFRLYKKDKLLRFFSSGDLILISDLKSSEDFSVQSEMNSKIRMLKKDQVFDLLSHNPTLLQEFYQWLECDQLISQYLCSLYIQEGNTPRVEVISFQKGETIITEGEKAETILILIDGSAEVFQQGNKIGEIARDEVFGELSFLTSSKRTATVKAKTTCMVQSIQQDDFVQVLPQRPLLMESLLRSMAQRIVKLNHSPKAS